MILSKRPGLKRAPSIKSILLVAPMTNTPSKFSIPSISVRIWLIIFADESVPSLSVFLWSAIASNSSKKTKHGASCLAFLKTSWIAFSDSPAHLDNNSAPFMLIKFAPEFEATAFANRIFPVPGIPYNSKPFGGRIPAISYISEWFNSQSIRSTNSSFNESKPPISLHLTVGFWIENSLLAEGVTSFKASLKSESVIVILSSKSCGIGVWSILTCGIKRLSERIAASFVKASKSAPTNPCVSLDNRPRSTSRPRGIPFVWIFSISSLPASSGIPISISLSNLPGRLRAGSIAFGLFDAPITIILPLEFIPSISVKSCDTIRLSTSPDTSSRFGAIESSSSIKSIDGDFSCACSKVSRSLFSLSP